MRAYKSSALEQPSSKKVSPARIKGSCTTSARESLVIAAKESPTRGKSPVKPTKNSRLPRDLQGLQDLTLSNPSATSHTRQRQAGTQKDVAQRDAGPSSRRGDRAMPPLRKKRRSIDSADEKVATTTVAGEIENIKGTTYSSRVNTAGKSERTQGGRAARVPRLRGTGRAEETTQDETPSEITVEDESRTIRRDREGYRHQELKSSQPTPILLVVICSFMLQMLVDLMSRQLSLITRKTKNSRDAWTVETLLLFCTHLITTAIIVCGYNLALRQLMIRLLRCPPVFLSGRVLVDYITAPADVEVWPRKGNWWEQLAVTLLLLSIPLFSSYRPLSPAFPGDMQVFICSLIIRYSMRDTRSVPLILLANCVVAFVGNFSHLVAMMMQEHFEHLRANHNGIHPLHLSPSQYASPAPSLKVFSNNLYL